MVKTLEAITYRNLLGMKKMLTQVGFEPGTFHLLHKMETERSLVQAGFYHDRKLANFPLLFEQRKLRITL